MNDLVSQVESVILGFIKNPVNLELKQKSQNYRDARFKAVWNITSELLFAGLCVESDFNVTFAPPPPDFIVEGYPSIKSQYQIIVWKHDENDLSKHLTSLTPGTVDIYGKAKIQADGLDIVSIWALKNDIKDSVLRSGNGYLARLSTDMDLQKKFTEAVNQIFDPAIIN